MAAGLPADHPRVTTQPAPPPRFIRSTTRRADLAVVRIYNIKMSTICREVGAVGWQQGLGRPYDALHPLADVP